MKTPSLFIGIKVVKATLESVRPDIVLAPRGPDEQARTPFLGFLPDRNPTVERWPVYEITTVVIDVFQQVYDREERAGAGGPSPAVLPAKPFNPGALLAGGVLLALPALLAVPAMLAARARASELPGKGKLAALRTRIQGLLPTSTPKPAVVAQASPPSQAQKEH